MSYRTIWWHAVGTAAAAATGSLESSATGRLLQAQCLQRLREHVYARSPYRNFHAGYVDRPPAGTAGAYQGAAAGAVRSRRDRSGSCATTPWRNMCAASRAPSSFLVASIVTATSGTTGSPTFVLFDGAEWAQVLSFFSRYESHVVPWAHFAAPGLRIVASSTPWHISARIGATVRSSLLPIQRLDIGQPISSIVESLNAWQPYTLATYASMPGDLGRRAAGRAAADCSGPCRECRGGAKPRHRRACGGRASSP